MSRFLALAILTAGLGLTARGQDPKADPVKPAASRITAVTLYQSTALVTREVTLPDAAGVAEVVVSPMPPQVIPTSLYAEGGDAGRVLSVRFRTRQIAEDTREEVRKLDAQLKTLTQKTQGLQADLKAAEENLKLLDKLEGFTAKSLETVTDKGQLDPEKIITLAKFVQDDRAKRAKGALEIKQQIEALGEQAEFTKRLLGERAGGSVRTERDAVVLVDKKAGPGVVRLSYLVSRAGWRPVYKLRAGAKDKDPVTLEYLAAVEQQTGEDWGNVNLTLSTAQPLLNAAPPDLRALEVAV
ncbi:MAG: mucoidy inhibitor MuiA family protein, partial [Gemmataceae bacterium]|nr:mucoidy inhibitor MuiA family protein [Gemmataceae bacterium]